MGSADFSASARDLQEALALLDYLISTSRDLDEDSRHKLRQAHDALADHGCATPTGHALTGAARLGQHGAAIQLLGVLHRMSVRASSAASRMRYANVADLVSCARL